MTVLEDTVALPSGQRIEWARMKHASDFVQVICLDDVGRVLVTRQYCHPPGRMVYEFPGGYPNAGESYEEAARRELIEEVGLYARDLEKIGRFLLLRRRTGLQGHLYVATGLEPREAAPEQEEYISLHWMTVPQVEAMVRAGEVEDVQVLSSWSLLRAKKPELFEVGGAG